MEFEKNELIHLLSTFLQLSDNQVYNTVKLLDGGASIPFISRYRKELTQGLDEVQVAAVKDQYERLTELAKRKSTIISTIEEAGLLTEELHIRIGNCWSSIELEDIYLPYKPKRRTKAQVARENGLEPLAAVIMKQQNSDLQKLAINFVKNEIKNIEEALNGAMDIIAEWISESEYARNAIRKIFNFEAYIFSKVVKGKETEGQKYQDYFDYSEKLNRCSSHRLLAVRRGESEGILKVNISPDDEHCIERLEKIFIKSNNTSSDIVYQALKDGYKRLLKPAIENEFALESKIKADNDAIKVFTTNLYQLLLAPPLGQKRTLGIDPGFRTGCKVVCLDAQGMLLHNETIYPHPPQSEQHQAMRKIQKLVEAYDIQVIAIGNGTAGRETEVFIQKIQFDRKVQVFVISENGASIYSASKVAREEFPDYDVTVRGAVSIGRRLMDPLAELVKIDPKSIGVGQYQHDVNQNELKKALDQTVENAVNRVGVNLNTASKHLLMYVSGLGPQLAQNIVDFRNQNGAFKSRSQLMNVPKMGVKTFEQSAGFLRIPDAANPLDNSAVHPESYSIAEKMAKDLKTEIYKLIRNKELLQSVDKQKYINDKVGLPTINDIIQELEKPGLDPRETVKVFEFDASVKTISDLRTDMELPGIVTNITNFGAFVDIGIKENGLIHISQMGEKFISNPIEVLSLHQHILVKVLEIDLTRKRVQLKLIK